MLQLRYLSAVPFSLVDGIAGFYAGHVRSSFGSSSCSGLAACWRLCRQGASLHVGNAQPCLCLNHPVPISLLSAFPQTLHREGVVHNSSHFCRPAAARLGSRLYFDSIHVL
jgi:hypothetical protein